MPRSKTNRADSHSMLRNIATLLSGTVLAQLIGIVSLPILSRLYGPISFGILAIFLSTSAIVSTVAALRYELAIVLPTVDDEARLLRQAAVVIVTALSLATAVVTLIIFFGTPAAARNWWVLFIGASVFLAGTTNTLYFWMTRKRRYRAQSISRVVQALSAAAAQALLGAVISPTGGWLIVGYVIGQALGLASLIIADRTSDKTPRPDPKKWWWLMVRYRKMPLLNAPNALVDSLRLNGINFILGSRSMHDLGQFSMAWKLASGATSLLSNAISQVYFPNMAEAKPGTLHQLVSRITIRALAMGLVPLLALALLAPVVLPWFLGPGWEQASFIVQALCPWLYLMIATSPMSTVFIVIERQGTMLAFAVGYLIVPLTVLLLAPADIVLAVWLLSAAMTILLVFLIFLTLHVTKIYDAKRIAEPSPQ